MSNITEISVDHRILGMNIEPDQSCGCYIHKALYEKFDLRTNQIYVNYTILRVGNDSYRTSFGIDDWQLKSIDLHKSGKTPDPIDIVLDHDLMIAYIKDECDSGKRMGWSNPQE